MFFLRQHEFFSWWPIGIGILFWLVVVGVLIWLVVHALSQQRGPAPSPNAGQAAEQDAAFAVLRQRFAAGEIDEDEYTKRAEVLRRR